MNEVIIFYMFVISNLIKFVALSCSMYYRYLIVALSCMYYRYLREEKLELQVWVSYGRKEDTQKSHHRDKLIGTVYIDLEALNNDKRRQHRVRCV